MEVFSLHKAPNRSTTAVVGYQSNQKLLHHYQHAKNELNLLIHSKNTEKFRNPYTAKPCPFLTAYLSTQKSLSFSFPEFTSSSKKKFVPSIHS